MTQELLQPQDLQSEQACLASILISKDALMKVTEILQPEDFYQESNRILYGTILDLERKALPVDLITLKQSLVDSKRFDRVGGDAALVELYRTVSTSANAIYYAKRIKELSLKRKLIEVATGIIEKTYDTTIDTDVLLNEAERDIFSVTEKRVTSDFRDIADIMKETLDNIGRMYETKKAVTGISSGFTDLDNMLTGFHADELIILAARPSMGKTAFALNIANNIALREKKPILFFSLEMPSTQLASRMLCIESMIDSQRVRTGHISSDELRKLLGTAGKMQQTPLYIDDTPGLTVFDIRAKARRVAMKSGGIGMVIIDYLQLINGHGNMERHQQIAEISRALKLFARELNCPIMALSQLSRAVESRTDQMPQLSDLRESGSIEQDADVVMFIYREERVKKDIDPERKGLANIIVAKQRNGPIGDVTLKFWDKYTRFDNLERHQTYDNAIPEQ